MRREHIIVRKRRPDISAGARSAAPEAVAAAAGGNAQWLAAPLRKQRGVLERSGELPALVLENLPRIRLQARVGEAGRKPDDKQHEQHLDERESPDPLSLG